MVKRAQQNEQVSLFRSRQFGMARQKGRMHLLLFSTVRFAKGHLGRGPTGCTHPISLSPEAGKLSMTVEFEALSADGLYKAEVIHRRGLWRNFEAVEFATLEWVDWVNNRRLLEPIGNILPAEAEER